MQCVMIASSKGGIGKSTVALGIGTALGRHGKKVLLCDLDLGNPCLDMLTGAEDSVLYTVSDVMLGRCSAADAVVTPYEGTDLQLLAAPAVPGDIGEEDGEQECAAKLADTVISAARELECDFAILDTGAGISLGARAAAMAADRALVVAGHSPISVRSAESTARRLRDMGVEDLRLIINSFDGRGVCGAAERKGVLSIIDASGLPLFGVIPYDYSLALSQEMKKGERGADAPIAFDNTARRLMRENVPLFSGMKKMRRMRNKFYK